MLSNAPPARKRKAAALTSGAVASSTELTSVFKACKASRDATKTRAVSATVRLLGISSMKAESLLMADALTAAVCVFERIQNPVQAHAERDLTLLLGQYRQLFVFLGGKPTSVVSEWSGLSKLVVRDDILRQLPLAELFSRLFLHFANHHCNVLLLAAIVQAAAMDVTLTDTSLIRSLKAEGQRKDKMLLFLVGRAWQAIGARGDASAVSVESLVKSWFVRKESAMSVAA